jgi:hypothetical protein
MSLLGGVHTIMVKRAIILFIISLVLLSNMGCIFNDQSKKIVEISYSSKDIDYNLINNINFSELRPIFNSRYDEVQLNNDYKSRVGAADNGFFALKKYNSKELLIFLVAVNTTDKGKVGSFSVDLFLHNATYSTKNKDAIKKDKDLIKENAIFIANTCNITINWDNNMGWTIFDSS